MEQPADYYQHGIGQDFPVFQVRPGEEEERRGDGLTD